MSDLKEITALAERQLDLEHLIEEAEESLKSLKEQHRAVSENDLPEAMEEAGMMEFKLKDGRKVTVNRKYHASIPKAHQSQAFRWLREHGHDGIIKRDITLKFGKGDDELARKIRDLLSDELGDETVGIADKEHVHHSTLRAFVREQIEAGEDLPMDEFGVFIRTVAEIK